MDVCIPAACRFFIVWVGIVVWGSVATMEAQLRARVEPVVGPHAMACSSAVMVSNDIVTVSAGGQIVFSDRSLQHHRIERLPDDRMALRLYTIGPLLLAYDRSRQLFQRLSSGTWVAASEPGVMLHRDADSVLYAYRDGAIRTFTRDGTGRGYNVVDSSIVLYGGSDVTAFGIAGDTIFTIYGTNRICRITSRDTVHGWLKVGYESGAEFEHMPNGGVLCLTSDGFCQQPEAGGGFWPLVQSVYGVYGYWIGALVAHGRDSAGRYVRTIVWNTTNGQVTLSDTRSGPDGFHQAENPDIGYDMCTAIACSQAYTLIGGHGERRLYFRGALVATIQDDIPERSIRYRPMVDERGVALCTADSAMDVHDPFLYRRHDVFGHTLERIAMPPGGSLIPRFAFLNDFALDDGSVLRVDDTRVMRFDPALSRWDSSLTASAPADQVGVRLTRLDSTLFLPASYPGLLHSSDKGRSWRYLAAEIPERYKRIATTAHAIDVIDGLVWYHTYLSALIFRYTLDLDTLPFVAAAIDDQWYDESVEGEPVTILGHHYADGTMYWYRLIDTLMHDAGEDEHRTQHVLVTTFHAGDDTSRSSTLSLPQGFRISAVGQDSADNLILMSHEAKSIVVVYAGVIAMELRIEGSGGDRLPTLLSNTGYSIHRTDDSSFVVFPAQCNYALVLEPEAVDPETPGTSAVLVPPSSLVARPNPASTSMTIVLSADLLEPGPERLRLRIVDIRGCEQRHRHGLDMAAATTEGTIEVELGGFTPGVYYAEVQRGSLRKVVAFVVQR